MLTTKPAIVTYIVTFFLSFFAYELISTLNMILY